MTDQDKTVGIDAEVPLAPPKRMGLPPKAKPIETLVIEIRGAMLDINDAKLKLHTMRLVAGQKLLELRARIEAGEAGDVTWWAFYEEHLAEFRSRKDAEKLMRMAGADDPEAALQIERAKDRNRKRIARSRGADVRSRSKYEAVESEALEAHIQELEAARATLRPMPLATLREAYYAHLRHCERQI